MSSIASLAAAGPIGPGDSGDDVRAVQLALSQAGYKVGIDGIYGEQTRHSVITFQQQHGLQHDGVVGSLTAALLDAPHEHLLAMATPLTVFATPHDDTASLLAFYGQPWQDTALLAFVQPPFPMYYGAQPIRMFQFHSKAYQPLVNALQKIWDLAGHDEHSDLLKHVRHFDGTYNYRPIRGSSRLSCHAFGAAIDFDAAHCPLGQRIPASDMPQPVVDAFKSEGFFWGGDFRGRPDPMHFQFAHE